MTLSRASRNFALLSCLITPQVTTAQVDEWFIDKAITYRQSENDTAPSTPYAWTIELAVITENPGDATSATISGGGIAGTLDLEWDDGEWLYEENFESEAAMDALFPSGQNYTLSSLAARLEQSPKPSISARQTTPTFLISPDSISRRG